jgi:RHS repeat-associated protein
MSAGSAIFCYDANGNKTQKIDGSSTSYTYDAENRMTAVSGAAAAAFVYDGDGRDLCTPERSERGNRVKGVVGGVTTTYIGNYFEPLQGRWTGSTSTMKKYYYAGGTRVAERVGTLSTSYYFLLTDHLGSTSITATRTGGFSSELRYKAWGETRYSSGSTPTTFRYTGQREESSLGLYWYNSRWYSPGLGRFQSADSIVPDPYNPVDWDRYGYVRNNPVKYIDANGHFPVIAIIVLAGAFLFFSQYPGDSAYAYNHAEGNGTVMAVGFLMMAVPAIVPASCVNDGNCTNEYQAVQNATDDLADATSDIQTAANTGKVLLETASKPEAREALRAGINGLSNGQTQKALDILRSGRLDQIQITTLENSNVQIVAQRAGADGFQRLIYTLDPSGKTINLIQEAYNAVGELVHVHEKIKNLIE